MSSKPTHWGGTSAALIWPVLCTEGFSLQQYLRDLCVKKLQPLLPAEDSVTSTSMAFWTHLVRHCEAPGFARSYLSDNLPFFTFPFPSNFQRQLPRWLCETNHLARQVNLKPGRIQTYHTNFTHIWLQLTRWGNVWRKLNISHWIGV